MANITKSGLAWMGTNAGCDSVQISSLGGKFRIGWTVPNSGTYLVDGNPGAVLPAWPTISCGGAFATSTVSGVDYDVANLTFAQKGSDLGRITTFYIPSFTVNGTNFSQAFKLTTSYTTDGKPVYKSDSKYIWSNGSSYRMSDAVGDNNGSVDNGSCHPNYWSKDASHGLSTNRSIITASGFTGQFESANGDYVQIGHFNGKESYAHVDCNKDWVFYFNGTEYKLSNQKYNGSGLSVGNGCDAVSNPCDSNCSFNGACVVDDDVPGGSLATEDQAAVLVTEDVVSVLVDESA